MPVVHDVRNDIYGDVMEEAILHRLSVSKDGKTATAELQIIVHTGDATYTAFRSVRLELD